MPEETVPPVTPVTPTPPTGTDPKSPDNGGSSTPVDLSKLSDEDFAKVFEDPRLYKHDRFKKLGEAKQKLAEIESQRSQQEEADLVKRKEWETLAEKRQKEIESYKGKFETAQIDNAIINEAAKKGITDLDAAKKLIERSKISLDENGNPQGVAEAVEQLAKDKPYLLGQKSNNNSSVGSGTNPPNPNQDYDFTMTQIQDPRFYQKNRDAILVAQAKGRIKEDRF